MKREDVHPGLLVRLVSPWLDVPPGTLATVDTVGALCGTWLFTVRWHNLKPLRQRRHRSDRSLNLWEEDLRKFEVVVQEEKGAPFATKEQPPPPANIQRREQLTLPFGDL
jgi:hypothetical protein